MREALAEQNLASGMYMLPYGTDDEMMSPESDFVRHHRAGPIVNARRLLPELVRRGHQVTALILYHEGASPAADYLADQGVEVRASPWLGTTQRHVHWMLKAIQDCRPDIFVPNISTAGWFAGRWCREALFFLVWSCPRSVVDANLCELAGIQ